MVDHLLGQKAPKTANKMCEEMPLTLDKKTFEEMPHTLDKKTCEEMPHNTNPKSDFATNTLQLYIVLNNV